MKRVSILLLIFCAVYASLARAQTTIPIDPRATYLRTNDDPQALDAVPISLDALGIAPGNAITLKALGDFTYWYEYEGGLPEDPNWLAAFVFSSSNVLLPSSNLNRVPGALAIRQGASPSVETWPTGVGDLPTDIPQDFGFWTWESATVIVPPGAHWLFVAVVDSYYGDNADLNGDLAIQIQKTIPYFNLHNFEGGTEGSNPWAAVVLDDAGNIFGTNEASGNPNCNSPWFSGCGTVWKVDKKGAATVLYSFTGADGDGAVPVAGLVRDADGNLYGTTLYGGTGTCYDGTGFGCGTVFKLNKKGKMTVLHSFADDGDGIWPMAGLLRDAEGNLYGTTSQGGALGNGAVFKVDVRGTETVIHSFDCSTGGCYPWGGLIQDAQGNLYGTTVTGGTYGVGTVFKLDATGTETVLYSFTGGDDGMYPSLGYLARDASGSLYGTTWTDSGETGNGVVYRLDKDGNQTVLHSFSGGLDGSSPHDPLVLDRDGNVYGTTQGAGANYCGVIFKIEPTGTTTVLHSFDWYQDGCAPFAGLVKDAKGDLYGTTLFGGPFDGGSVFRLATSFNNEDEQ
jgi:uncharacterized repeat protein (TIGR03803 family)